MGNKTLRIGLLTVLLLAITLACTVSMAAESGEYEGLKWELDDSGTLTVSGSGPLPYFTDETQAWQPKEKEIHKVVIGEGITEVGAYTFDNLNITSVTLPDSLEKICEGAFSGCKKLTNVKMPERLSWLYSFAFMDCTSLKSITLPSVVENFEDAVFAGCTSLTDVTLKNGLTRIGNSAFSGCTALAELKLTDSITVIGERAFMNCTALTGILIPDKVDTILSNAFAGCVHLKSVTLPNSKLSISDGAFSGCKSLAALTIPKKVMRLGEEVFSGCSKLTLHVYPDSKGLEYAKENGIPYQVINDSATLDSVKFAKKKATVKQKVTINAVTSTGAAKLIMYQGSKEIQSWTKGYTDKDGKRTWKVTCTFTKAGARTMDFRAADKNGKLTAAKSAKITITKAPALSKVTLSTDKAKRKETFTVTAVTSTNVTQLTMYLNGKVATTWTEGYTDKNGKRTWKVTYAFSKAGKKTLSFMALDANGAGTAKKTVEIKITK